METLQETRRMNTFTITVPHGSQTNLLRSLSRNMGWKAVMQKPKKTRLQLAIEEARKGPTFQTNSIEELMEHLMK